QGAGKSTFYRERFFATHLRINLDMLKTRHRENRFLQACIETRQPFVVDNTNATCVERQVYIEAARRAGLRVVGYYFQSSVGDGHDLCVLPGLYMVARLDGRSFTRLTREVHQFEAPFDPRFRDLMVETAEHLMSGCGLNLVYGYTQSDEISLLFGLEENSFGR